MKSAYPNFSDSKPSSPIYNISKWMDAMKDIYIKMHLGATKTQSVDMITKGWNDMEKTSFLDWLKYYESGDHSKYKRAQLSYYVNDDINYFLPNPKQAPSPIRSINDQIDATQQEAAAIVEQKKNQLSEDDKRKIIEEQRKKILGRLHSAEKLLSSQHGQMFAGTNFEKILSAIYELKKQIQTINNLAISAQTVVDLIIRQANILDRQGHKDAAQFFVKFAQNSPGDFSMNLSELPAAGSQPNAGGSLGNNTPNLATPPAPEGKEITQDSAVGEFIDNLEDSGITTPSGVDTSEADDEVEMDNDVMMDQEITPEDGELVVHAQAIPPDAAAPPPPKPTPRPKPAPKEDLEVESPSPKGGDAAATGISPEEAKEGPQEPQVKNDFDALIDSVFSNLTVADVVGKLEDINKIFRNREISRQLAIVDVMLDRLGLAPYFPALAEATNKQLEANQYCLTRIEDILSKLRGTMQTAKIDLKNENQGELAPDAAKAKQSIEQGEAKEKQRKEMKKQVEDQTALEKAVKPEGEVEGAEQDLANQPTQIEKAVNPQPKPAIR